MHPACANPAARSPVSNRLDRILIFIRYPFSVSYPPALWRAWGANGERSRANTRAAAGLGYVAGAFDRFVTPCTRRGPLEHNSSHEAVQRLPTRTEAVSAAEVDALRLSLSV